MPYLNDVFSFVASVQSALVEADSLAEDLVHMGDDHSRMTEGMSSEEVEASEIDFEFGNLQRHCTKLLDKADLLLLSAFDLMSCPSLAKRYEAEMADYRDDLAHPTHYSYSDVWYFPCVPVMEKYVEVIIAHHLEEGYTDYLTPLKTLRRILKGIPTMLHDAGVGPNREKDVQDQVFNTLKHTFPDTVRETGIAQVTRTSKFDVGVRSLKTAIEFKYAESKERVKVCIEGIAADVSNYHGSNDWRYFFAVIYQSEPFFTEDQLKAQMELMGIGRNWEFMLVHGVSSNATPPKTRTSTKT